MGEHQARWLVYFMIFPINTTILGNPHHIQNGSNVFKTNPNLTITMQRYAKNVINSAILQPLLSMVRTAMNAPETIQPSSDSPSKYFVWALLKNKGGLCGFGNRALCSRNGPEFNLCCRNHCCCGAILFCGVPAPL